MIVIKATPPTAYAPRRVPNPDARGVGFAFARHELDLVVEHYDRAAEQAPKPGAHRAAEAAAWRTACLRRPR